MRAPVRIAAISLVATAGLLALKLTLGLISDSIAVLGDAVDSGTDLPAATAALVSIQIAARPADEDHLQQLARQARSGRPSREQTSSRRRSHRCGTIRSY